MLLYIVLCQKTMRLVSSPFLYWIRLICAIIYIKLIRRIDKEKIIEYTTMSDKVNEFAVSLFMRLWVEMQQV